MLEIEKIYQQDKQEYIITRNANFLKWLDTKMTDGYDMFLRLKEIQKMIDFISNWYEIKYPERELQRQLQCEDLKVSDDFEDVQDISENLNFRQLMFRLSESALELIECNYRAEGYGSVSKYKNGKYIDNMIQIFMQVDYKNNSEYNHLRWTLVSADHCDGVVDKYSLKTINVDIDKDITLEELLKILDDNKRDDLDYSKIRKAVNNHKIDLELRKYILSLIALKLVYSEKTIPKYGYERAKKFIAEFNQAIPELNLTTEQIDEVINRDYQNVVIPIYSTNLLIDEIQGDKKIKRFFKSIFNKR